MVRWGMPSPVITIFVVQFMLSAFILDLAFVHVWKENILLHVKLQGEIIQ